MLKGKGKGLIAGMLILAGIFTLLIGLYATGMIGGLVVGSISNVATSGDITVSSAMNTSIAALETSYIADTTSIFGNTGLIIALVAIVVLVIVFGIKFNMGTGRKSGGVE
jgi:hypothetical protein